MSDEKSISINYEPDGPTLVAFHESEMFFRGIMGPFGSAKSTACTMEILSRIAEQKHAPDGRRKSRWAVVRNSYPELKTTTLKTWNQWVPAQYGRLTMDSPIRHYLKTAELEMEILFLALDRDEDVKKLLSLELTGAWLNEAREIPKGIVDGITGRVGRYPMMAEGGCTWSGVIADTNPPDDQSWWYHWAEEETPEGYEFFKQPGGRSPNAENMKNLPPGYYTRMAAGKDPDWIKVYVDGEYGFVVEGKPVFPMYRDRSHCPEEGVDPVPGLPIEIGADLGLTPAAAIGQKKSNGQWRIIDEFVTDNCGVIRFSEQLTKYIATNYPGYSVANCTCDPSASKKSETDERSSLELLNKHTPWRWKPAPTNLLVPRLEVVRAALNRMVDGDPGFVLSKKCKVIRKGFSGGYCYQLIKTGDGTQTHEEPKKNQFSHPHDGLQYLLLGGGEYNNLVGKGQSKKDRSSIVCVGADYRPLQGIGQESRREPEPPWKKRIRKF
jgi:hypothetical protein